MKRTVRKFLAELDPKIMCAGGYDSAVMGYSKVDGSFRAVYDIEKMVNIFMTKNDASREEAWEYLQFNCWDQYVGKQTPIYVQFIDDKEIGEWIDEISEINKQT